MLDSKKSVLETYR